MAQKHPYADDVAGGIDAVARIGHEQLLEFNRLYYHPERILLVIDGDVEPGEVQRLIDHDWASWARSRRLREGEKAAAAQGSATEARRAQVAQAHFGFGFSLDTMSLEERASLALLAAVLGQGESSRLVRTLQYEHRVVNGVFAYRFRSRRTRPHGHRRHHERCSLAGCCRRRDSQPGAGRSLRGERRCARALAGAGSPAAGDLSGRDGSG